MLCKGIGPRKQRSRAKLTYEMKLHPLFSFWVKKGLDYVHRQPLDPNEKFHIDNELEAIELRPKEK